MGILFGQNGERVSRWDDPEIIRGYWTDANNQSITEARLESMVRFHIETKGIPNGHEVMLQLFDEDTFRDDKKFGGKEVRNPITIRENKGYVDLNLPSEWSDDLKNEEWYVIITTIKIHYRKLYWKATYKNWIEKEEIESYLKIFYSDKTLYVKPSAFDRDFPEMYATTGEIIMVVLSPIYDVIEERGVINAAGEARAHRYALAKLAKGYLVDDTGRVRSPLNASGQQRQIVNSADFTNDGQKILTRRGRDFEYMSNDGIVTTKGISQYDQFNNRSAWKMLGYLDFSGNVLDLFHIASWGMKGNHNDALPIPIPGADVLGAMAMQQFAEMDTEIDRVIEKKVNEKKIEGYVAVRNYLSEANRISTNIKYELLRITNDTASKIMSGEINKYKNVKQEFVNPDLHALCKKVRDSLRGMDIYIIDAFFFCD